MVEYHSLDLGVAVLLDRQAPVSRPSPQQHSLDTDGINSWLL